jgi:UDP-N-acetylmuramoylalanine--D-glutamate ligase
VSLLDNNRLLVLGLGKSGISVARLLAKRGYEVVLADDDAAAVRAAQESAELAGLEGGIDSVAVNEAMPTAAESACVIASPGVPLAHPVVAEARRTGIPVVGELEIASRFCSSPIIGVTGTNGKSTVVSIIGDILKAAGLKSVVAGNIGTPFCDVVDAEEAWDVVVLEISSFQLDTILDFKTRVAAILNITPDHLDRYNDSIDEYTKSKSRILLNADDETVFVYNSDDPRCKKIADDFVGTKVPFSSSKTLGAGVYSADGAIVRVVDGQIERVISIDEFPPVGIHNLENAMASVAAVIPFDVEKHHIEQALAADRPLPHRMEPVKTVGGVTYINDSKATNVDATIKSLRSIESDVVLIMGGLDKNGEFGLLEEHLAHVKLVVLIGDAKQNIKKVLTGKCRLSEAATMEEAVELAAEVSNTGDTVLLAPACASFDMFENYGHRGEVFRAAVNALKE